MINRGIQYKVTGRYMDGNKVCGYHLVGEDGSQSIEGRDRMIYLITSGYVVNMRLQKKTDGSLELRGKGIDVNKLPAYDVKKKTLRNTDGSRELLRDGVESNKGSIQLGQCKVSKRIMMDGKCIGYELVDYSGAVSRKTKQNVLQLASEKLISNAHLVTRNKDGKTVHALSGDGCDLRKLPILIVNAQGKIIDPNKEKDKLSIRVAYIRSSGILHRSNGSSKNFKFNSYIVCTPDGKIDVVTKEVLESKYEKDTISGSAVCDDYLGNVAEYSIEIFGRPLVKLNKDMVKNWLIFKPISGK